MDSITITRPDDWHLHLRDNEFLKSVLPDTAERFARAIIMPNLPDPVVNTVLAGEYRDRILNALPSEYNDRFTPLMTLYLTGTMTPHDIREAKKSVFVHAVKWYPAGATTNSDKGVRDINQCLDVLKTMEEVDLPLLVHGEVTDQNIDIFDREAAFIEQFLEKTVTSFPNLRVVFEHITTENAVKFVKSASKNVGATITAHHLLLNRNAIFKGGIRPHHYCLPVLKREKHREALVEAATSGNSKFFLGTDSAPHTQHAKEAPCGCAGIYTSHGGIEFYAEVFEKAGALDKLETFASFNGPDFYGLPRNNDTITLRKIKKNIADFIPFGDEICIPFRAGGEFEWVLD